MRADSRDLTILVAEDDAVLRRYLEVTLKGHGYNVQTAEDGEEVLSCFRSNTSVTAILLDIQMPRKDGMEVLREIRSLNDAVPVIMVSGSCTPLNVVDAMREGATDFIGKPIVPEELLKAVNRAVETVEETPKAKVQRSKPQTSPEFRSRNSRMRELESVIARIGWSDAPVLVQGETGVGKEVFARQLHAQSPRSNNTLLKLNCAALPSELVESELFGYERGAFTGAFERKLGMFEQADKGTILLDEIGDMDIKLQAKLLQVLQDHEFVRLGGKSTIRVDVRVIAATHRNLKEAVRDGTFREDLYYRLNVISLNLPALRERPEDILPLAEVLLRKHAAPGAPIPTLVPALREALLAHDWPGNIRELENVMRKLLVFNNQEQLAEELRRNGPRTAAAPAEPAAIPVMAARSAAPTPLTLKEVSEAKAQAEIATILTTLNSTHWNRKQAAGLLGMDYKAFLYKMKKLGIEDKATAAHAAGSQSTYAGSALGMSGAASA